MDQTQGPARYHTHFYDVAGADLAASPAGTGCCRRP